jgi:hypothetical protein
MGTTSPGRLKALRILTSLLLPCFPALLACFQIINGDIGFHIATGRAIDLFGEIPTQNVLSFTVPEQPWILHQWIPAYLFHRVDLLAGPAGLLAVKCAVIYLTFLFLWLAMCARRPEPDPAGPLLWYVLAVGAAASRFLVRPFLFSDLGLATLLFVLARAERDGPRRQLWAAAFCCGVTAALHAGAVYLLLLMAALAAARLAAWLATGRTADGKAEAISAAAAFGGSLLLAVAAVTVESPWGFRALLLPFEFSSNAYYHAHLAEFRPLPFDLELYPFAWLLLIGSAVLLVLTIVKERADWRGAGGLGRGLFELAAFVGFVLLVLKHQRIIYDAALVLGFLAARWSLTVAPARSGRAIISRLNAVVAAAVAALAIFLQFSAVRFGPGLDDRFYPKRAFEFVREQALPDNAYVSDGWAGQWLWAFYPERRVFYDNRLEAYSFEFYRGVYQAIRYGEPGWQEKLDSYGVNTLVLKYSTTQERSFQEGRPNLRDLAFSSDRWRLLYWDDIGMVYVRDDPAQGWCADCRQYRHFEPDRMAVAPGSSPEALHEELAAAWETMPSGRACFVLAEFLLGRGRKEEAVALLAEGLERFPGLPFLEDFAADLVAPEEE